MCRQTSDKRRKPVTGKPQLLGVHNAMDSLDAARQTWERWFLLSLCSKCCVSSCISFIMGCMYIFMLYIVILYYIIYIILIFINSYIQSLDIRNAIIYNPSIYIYIFHHAAMRLEESEHQELLRSERVLSALRQAQQSLQKRQERLKLVVV